MMFTTKKQNQRHLRRAFDRLLNNPKMQEKINVFTATTGAGKTHLVFNDFVRKLYDRKGIKAFFYQVPQLELLDQRFIERSLQESLQGLKWKILNVSGGNSCTLSEMKDDIESNDITVILCTDAWVNFQTRNSYIEYYCEEIAESVSIWRDELHYGSSSSAEVYKMNVGTDGSPNYKGKLFRLFKKALKGGVLCFGSTATPTNEISQVFAAYGIGTDLYSVVTEWVEPIQLAGEMKFMSDPTPVSISGVDDPKINDLLQDMAWSLHYEEKGNREYITGQLDNLDPLDVDSRAILKKIIYKKTGYVKVENHYSSKEIPNIDIHQIKKKMHEIVKPAGFQWIVATKKGWELYEDGNVEPVERGKAGSNGWLALLKDPKHPVRMVIVVLKGNMGINVENLSKGLILRSSDNLRDIEGKRVMTNQLQTLGRFNRPYRGGLENSDIQKLSRDIQFEIYKRMNVFDIKYVATDSWKETIEVYKEKYGVTERSVYEHYFK